MERDDEEETQGLIDGRAVFEANHTRRLITIEDQTAGQAIRMFNTDDEIELFICFEDEDRYFLVFGAKRDNSSQFHLKFVSQNDTLSGTRGSLEYGGQPYRLRFSGGTPYVMLKLERKGQPVTYQHRAPGRRVESSGLTGTETPVPLTIEVLNRLKRSADFAIDQCQFFLSSRIILEKLTEESRVYLEDGIAVFENNNTTRLISFEDQTEGLALRLVENRESSDLFLCFDSDDKYQIKFSARGTEPNVRFSLQFTPQNDPLSDARGSLEYGDQTYRLRFSGGTPHLTLILSQTEEAQTQQRTAPGRRVGQ